MSSIRVVASRPATRNARVSARADELALRVRGLEASTLIELTAFGTAVMMNFRYTDALDGVSREATQ